MLSVVVILLLNELGFGGRPLFLLTVGVAMTDEGDIAPPEITIMESIACSHASPIVYSF